MVCSRCVFEVDLRTREEELAVREDGFLIGPTAGVPMRRSNGVSHGRSLQIDLNARGYSTEL